MTVKTLIKHGRSYALVIPRALMQQLGIAPNTQLKLSVDGRAIRIEPVSDETGPNFELIRARKKFHVSLLKKTLPPIDPNTGAYSDEQKKEIQKIARQNVYADTAPLTKFEQSIMLEQVLDDLLAFGPLTPFLYEFGLNQIFMSFDYTFWTEGSKLPILFDSEQHAEESLSALKRTPHAQADDDGWVKFEIGQCSLFVPELLLSD